RTGPYTQANTFRVLRRSKEINTTQCLFLLVPHVVPCCSTGFPLRLSQAGMCVGWRGRRANHRDAAVTSFIPALWCRLCRPNAPFPEFVRLSRTSIAYEMREDHRRRVLGERPRGQGFRRLCCWQPYSDSISVMPSTCSAVTARRH